MDWVTIAEEIAKIGLPVLGAALSGGASPILQAAIGEAFSAGTVDAIHAAVTSDPDAKAKLQEVQDQHCAHQDGPSS